MTRKGEKDMRAQFAKTALVVDEGSLASTVQARDLLRIADALRIPRVVLVGDRIRWTRNDAGLGLVNSQTAEVDAVRDVRVTFRLENGRMLDLNQGDSQLRHVDRAWASTVHAFQGRTVDTVIAAMEANHPNLTTQKTLYVEISRARDRAELVTDDRAALKEQLEAVTGERIAALEAVEPERAKSREAGLDRDRTMDPGRDSSEPRGRGPEPDIEKTRAPKSVDRDLAL